MVQSPRTEVERTQTEDMWVLMHLENKSKMKDETEDVKDEDEDDGAHKERQQKMTHMRTKKGRLRSPKPMLRIADMWLMMSDSMNHHMAESIQTKRNLKGHSKCVGEPWKRDHIQNGLVESFLFDTR